MSSNEINEQLIAQAAPVAQMALLTALLKHVSANQPEILRAIMNDAIQRVPVGKEFEGEESIGRAAQLMLEHQCKGILSEIQPASQLGGGFQNTVRR